MQQDLGHVENQLRHATAERLHLLAQNAELADRLAASAQMASGGSTAAAAAAEVHRLEKELAAKDVEMQTLRSDVAHVMAELKRARDEEAAGKHRIQTLRHELTQDFTVMQVLQLKS